jgi:hypothetical protein
MSCCIHARACTDNTGKEFQKHLKSLKFCIENKLSLPKETYEYLSNAFDEDELIDDYELKYVLEKVEDGFSTTLGYDQSYIEIDYEEIPKDTKKIIIELKW